MPPHRDIRSIRRRTAAEDERLAELLAAGLERVLGTQGTGCREEVDSVATESVYYDVPTDTGADPA